MAKTSSPLVRRHRLIAINLGLIRPKHPTVTETSSLKVYQWCCSGFVKRSDDSPLSHDHRLFAWRVAFDTLEASIPSRAA